MANGEAADGSIPLLPSGPADGLRTVGSGVMITSGWACVIAGHPTMDVAKFKPDRSMQPVPNEPA